MSPGNFPKKGTFEAKRKIKPRKIKIEPKKIKILAKETIINKFFLNQIFWPTLLLL